MKLPTLRGEKPVQTSLATWLGGGSVLIAFVSLGIMGLACTLLVERLVSAQAVTQAEFAVASARDALRRVGDERLADARILADRPTLRRLLNESDGESLDRFLERFCDSSQADICAVFGPSGLVVRAGPAVPWEAIAAAQAQQGERFSLAPADGGPVLIGAAAALLGKQGYRAVAISRANAALLAGIGHELGAEIRLVNLAAYTAPATDPLTGLHSKALGRGSAIAELVPALNTYVGNAVLSYPNGERFGLLEAHLNADVFDSQTRRFRWLLALVITTVAILAGLVGRILGRHLAAPVMRLGVAAQQIGRGDFSAPIPTAGPREVRALGNTMDDMRRNLVELVDTLRRREEETRTARRARDSVLGNISHEFRTPLAAQMASIEMLRDGLESLPPADQRQLLSNVERGGRRLMRLIDNLLESVRIESGQLSIRKQSVDPREIVLEATEWMAPLLAQRGLRVNQQLPETTSAILGDAQRLVQVLVNLLSNAAKFAPENSVIIIGGEYRDGTYSLWVEDEGPGLPDGDSAPLFERFSRGGAQEPEAPGLGLGLAIVKSIIERHAGSIDARRTPASRTRFTMTLPLEIEA